jgi:adenosylcobyric acid synthase
LPGSKHVASDLAWLRSAGLEAPLRAHVAAGRRVLGICGGLQMLGQRIEDHSGRDSDAEGLGLLAVRSELAPTKHLASHTEARFATLSRPWSALSGRTVAGYEIRHGHTSAHGPVDVALPDGLGWIEGPVLGLYLHGLLEDPEVLTAVLGTTPAQSLDETIDRLTDGVMAALDERALGALVQLE